jgi:ParB-like chromosome segregation protein Spo0J
MNTNTTQPSAGIVPDTGCFPMPKSAAVDDSHTDRSQSVTAETIVPPGDPQQVTSVPVANLQPHPLNTEVYGDGLDEDFAESIRVHGIRTPLLITRKNCVVSGHQRLAAATAAKLESVPVMYLDGKSDLETRELLLELNRNRLKTTTQKLREYRAFRRIETEKAKQRKGTRTDQGEKFPAGEQGRARDHAAKMIDLSGKTAEKGLKILEIAERCHGSDPAARNILDLLNTGSIEATAKAAVDAGLMESAKSKPAKSKTRLPAGATTSDGIKENSDTAPEAEDEPGETVPPSSTASPAPTPAALPQNVPAAESASDHIAGANADSTEILFQFMDGTGFTRGGWCDGWVKEDWIRDELAEIRKNSSTVDPETTVLRQKLLVNLSDLINRTTANHSARSVVKAVGDVASIIRFWGHLEKTPSAA